MFVNWIVLDPLFWVTLGALALLAVIRLVERFLPPERGIAPKRFHHVAGLLFAALLLPAPVWICAACRYPLHPDLQAILHLSRLALVILAFAFLPLVFRAGSDE